MEAHAQNHANPIFIKKIVAIMSIDVRFPTEKELLPTGLVSSAHIVTPGEDITSEGGFMRGHGTYTEGDTLVGSVAGVVDIVNKLVCVRPLRTRYNPEVGDVVIGRVTEVCAGATKVSCVRGI